MNRSRILVAIGILMAILFTAGCKQATSDTPAATTTTPSTPGVSSAPAASLAKYTAAATTLDTASSNITTAMGNQLYYTLNTTTGVMTINYPNDTKGIAISGTVSGVTGATYTYDVTITLTSVDDGKGNKISGTIKFTGTGASQGSVQNFRIKSTLTVVMLSPASTTAITTDQTMVTDAANKTTNSGTVTLDGVSYAI